MAFNIKNVKGALGAGLGQMAQAPGANGPAGPQFGDTRQTSTGEIEVYTQSGWINPNINTSITSVGSLGSLSISNVSHEVIPQKFPEPRSVIAIETKVGRISIDVETGDLTIPQGIGRDQAIREFWLGFQEYFKPANTAKYEKEIKDLERELASTKVTAALIQQEELSKANNRVAEKVRKKYGNEKFIMVKPDDLIKFIIEG